MPYADPSRRKPELKRLWRPKPDRPEPESVRVDYPSHWSYDEKCVADEKRINAQTT